MNEDFGVGRRRPVSNDGPRHRYSYSNLARERRHPQAPQSAPAVKPKPADTSLAKTAQPSRLDHTVLPAPVSTKNDSNSTTDDDQAGIPAVAASSTSAGPWYKRLAAKLTRKQWLMVGGAFALLVGGGATAYALLQPDETPQPVAKVQKKAAPKPPPPPPVSPLTGMPVSAEDAKHVVTAVMIENSTNARPQSSLQQAGVVYEAIAEYGITRFMALFQEAKPANIGPVRSVRPYYVDWAKIYDAPLAHVGGSPDALQKIKAENVKDLDQFFNAPHYHRVSSRFAPHNVYTSMAELNKAAAGRGWTTSQFAVWPRKKDTPSKTPAAAKIDIAISSPTYNVSFAYDPNNNNYKRLMAGAPHVDADSQAQITPKVVIGLATAYGLEADGYHSKYATAGSGSAFIFQDGDVIPVTWSRQGNDQYSFLGADNKPVKLNAGQTWITVVGDPAAVTYKP